ncbi:MAG: molybdopterin biosynthesis protein MoeB, partial [Myxococcales bacterium]|nr:molybdopterin biosynthesis protein MoeB [Myxococcales bacterium]
MASFSEILSQVKQAIHEVSVEETKARAEASEPPVVVDIRERDEYEQGYIPKAHWIPRGFLEIKVEDLVPERDREIILYCAGGTRSALAARSLGELGYSKVSSMAGGFRAWKNAGYRFDRPRTLSPEQLKRYSRHIMLPEVGEIGQGKLLDAR